MSILHTLPDASVLLAARADIVRQLAPLRARYGGNGYAGERLLKLTEARIQSAVRARAKAANERPTEGAVDAEVRQHDEYIAALTQDVRDRQQWIEHEEALNDIEWRLRLRESDARLLAAEARLTGMHA